MKQRTLFWLLLAATIGYYFFMKQAVTPLTSKEIVAYELAKTPDRAMTMLLDFASVQKIELVWKSLYLDFVFLLLYGSALFVGCRYAARLAGTVNAPRTWIRLNYHFAWLGIIGLVADVIENIVLLTQLPPGNVTAFTAQLAWAMASLKFIAILISLLAALIGFGFYAIKRRSLVDS